LHHRLNALPQFIANVAQLLELGLEPGEVADELVARALLTSERVGGFLRDLRLLLGEFAELFHWRFEDVRLSGWRRRRALVVRATELGLERMQLAARRIEAIERLAGLGI
jgi:hypothetical protein